MIIEKKSLIMWMLKFVVGGCLVGESGYAILVVPGDKFPYFMATLMALVVHHTECVSVGISVLDPRTSA